MVDFIAYADGKTDIIDISDKIEVPISELISVIKELNEAEFIKILKKQQRFLCRIH